MLRHPLSVSRGCAMPVLTIANAQRGRISAEMRADDDTLLGVEDSRFVKNSEFRSVAESLGMDWRLLMKFIDDFKRNGQRTVTHTISLSNVPPITIRLRPRVNTGMLTPLEFNGEPRSIIEKIINDTTFPSHCEPMIEWDDLDTLAMVDLDVLKADVAGYYTHNKMVELLSTFQPLPFAAWVTHGGGLRLAYHSMGGFTALELASVAHLNLSASVVYDRIEIKKQTRHPAYRRTDGRGCSTPKFMEQQTDMSIIRRWMRQITSNDDEVQSWLENNNLEVGKRYPHSCCPVNPSDEGKRDPVMVNEDGIFCHICESQGVSIGGNLPGFFPFGSLLRNTVGSLFACLVRNVTHWEHAQHVVINKMGIRGFSAKGVYSAALKCEHGTNDQRIPMAFMAGQNLIRFHHKWATNQGETYTKEVKPLIDGLPAVYDKMPDGSLAMNRAKVSTFENPVDLTTYGYPHLTPTFGMSFYGYHAYQPDRIEIPVVLQTSTLAREDMIRYRPKYVHSQHRMSIDDAWAHVELTFPGIYREFITLLIAAKGVAEVATSMPPMVYVAGPTGTSKTTSISVAAAICGDIHTEGTWSTNVERIRQQVINGRDNGTFVSFNEVIKNYQAAKGKMTSSGTALDTALGLTEGSTSHQMYIGPVKLGALPVLVWTDTTLPFQISEDQQLARRLIYVQLLSSVNWQRSINNLGMKIHDYRCVSERNTDACNSIVSHIIDKYFTSSMTFAEIAHDLGYSLMCESDALTAIRTDLRHFFDLVCKADTVTGSDALRWKGRGWKKISRSNVSPLAEVWLQLCDEANGGAFTESRTCSAEDWGKLLGVDRRIEFQIRPNGNSTVAVRFYEGKSQKQYLVNEELTNGDTSNVE